MTYTQEWFTRNLLMIREALFSGSIVSVEDGLRGCVKVTQAVAQVSQKNASDILDVVVNKLLRKESERQAFFEEYGVPHESEAAKIEL